MKKNSSKATKITALQSKSKAKVPGKNPVKRSESSGKTVLKAVSKSSARPTTKTGAKSGVSKAATGSKSKKSVKSSNDNGKQTIPKAQLPAKKPTKRGSPTTVSAKAPAKKMNGSKVKTVEPKKPVGKSSTKPSAEKQVTARNLGTKSLLKKSVGSKPLLKKPVAKRPEKKLGTSHDYSQFKEILLAKRRRLYGDVAMMSEEALGSEEAVVDNHAPIHPAEVGSHSFEQEFTLGLLSRDGDKIRLVDLALEKMAEGSYGLCDECGGRIPKGRLEMLPESIYCVRCASKLEGLGF